MKTKPILKFMLFFITIYGSLIITGFLNEEYFEKRLRAYGNFLFEDFKGKGIVVFDKLEKVKEKHFNTEIKLASKQEYETYKKVGTPYKIYTVEASGWNIGFLPITLLVSLILATPVPWNRKGIALLWGLLLGLVFIWFQLYLRIHYKFEQIELLDVVGSYSLFGQKIMDSLYYLFVESMGTRFILPALFWIVATFRKGDLERILGEKQVFINR